ncbi:efflux RND transporter periplasmic adaptor subunit [Colwellia sp. MEBiC06753]
MTDPVVDSRKKAKRMVPLRYVLTPIVIIFVAIFLLIIAGILAPKPMKKPVEVRAPLVEVIELAPATIEFRVASQGSVMPRTATTLTSEVSGQVIAVSDKFFIGGYIEKGEEILRLDPITYEVALLQAESRLGAAKANLISEQALAKQAKEEWLMTGKPLEKAPILALREPQLLKAQAELVAAEADLKEAKTKLARTRFVAPYDAMIKVKNADLGQYVTVGTSLAEIFAVDYAEVRLPVKQQDLAFLSLPKVNETLEESSSIELFYQLHDKKHSWQGALTRYEGVVDSVNRAHYVVAKIDDPYRINSQRQDEIRVGTFVNAQIIGRSIDHVTAIPRLAVHGANTIYLVNADYTLDMIKIDVLRADAEFVYTLDSLPVDKRLVLTNIETPVIGMHLRVSGEQQSEQVESSDSGDSAKSGDKA